MGMSASQARLIQLTARMNDIEFQGQQINQQRTYLATHSSAYYNSLLDMTVPTPPAKTDFVKIEYGASYQGSKFTLGSVTPGSNKSSYNVEMKYTKTGHYFSSDKTCSVLKGKMNYKVVNDEFATTITNAVKNISTLDTDKHWFKPAGADFSITTLNSLDYLDPQDLVYVQMTKGQYKSLYGDSGNVDIGDNTVINISSRQLYEIENANQGAEDYVLKTLDVKENTNIEQNDNTPILLTFTKAELEKLENKPPFNAENNNIKYHAVKTPNGNLKEDLIGSDSYTDTTDNRYFDKQFLETALQGYTSYVVKDTNGQARAVKADDLTIDPRTGVVTIKEGVNIGSLISQDEADKLAQGATFAIGEDTDDKVYVDGTNDKNLLELSSYFTNLTDPSVLNQIEGMRHTFPEFKDLSDQELLAKFKYYISTSASGEPVLNIVKKSDIAQNVQGQGQIKAYQYIPNGTYTDASMENDCQLEFDTSGRITKVGIPDGQGGVSWIKLEATETTDDDAYEDAFQKYTYSKYLYDQEQTKINAQISIIQAEDKNLELKLTRLDNERNAVNTEIEAVKKVVDDNIEKSYKTFSG